MVTDQPDPSIASEVPQQATVTVTLDADPDLEAPFPPIGSLTFIPALLNHVSHKPTCPPIDPSIFQSILLCIVAGDKHLILRTNEADIGAVAKVAASTLASVFAYSTHRLKIKPPAPSPADPQGFLRSLFLPYAPLSTSGDGHGRKHAHRSHAQTKTRSYTRSYSFPNELGYVTSQIAVPTSKSSGAFDASPSPSASVHQPHWRRPPPSPSKPPIHAPLSRSHSETAPHDGSDETETQSVLQLPRALVISGLEHAGFAAQRALIQVLAERRVVLENESAHRHGPRNTKNKGKSKMTDEAYSDPETGRWNLPEGFIMVYVCPLDPRERPAIHKSLLDRFSMSTTISLNPNIRQDIQSLSGSHSHKRSQTLSGLASPSLNAQPHFLLSAPEPHLPPALLTALRLHCDQAFMAHKLTLYTSDLFTAARHHQEVDGTLLSARARRETDSLIKACRVLGLGGEVLAPLNAQTCRQQEPSAKNMPSNQAPANINSQDGGASHPPYNQVQVLSVSDSDVARIVPRVISHRLRVLDSPEDQIHASAFFGAFQDISEPKRFEGWVRRTVKDIVVEILSTV